MLAAAARMLMLGARARPRAQTMIITSEFRTVLVARTVALRRSVAVCAASDLGDASATAPRKQPRARRKAPDIPRHAPGIGAATPGPDISAEPPSADLLTPMKPRRRGRRPLAQQAADDAAAPAPDDAALGAPCSSAGAANAAAAAPTAAARKAPSTKAAAAARKGGPTKRRLAVFASELAACAGINPYRTRWEGLQRMWQRWDPEGYAAALARHGRQTRDEVVEAAMLDAPELVQLFERAVEQSGSSPSDAAAAAGAQLRAHAQDLGLSAAVTAGVEDALREAVNTAYGSSLEANILEELGGVPDDALHSRPLCATGGVSFVLVGRVDGLDAEGRTVYEIKSRVHGLVGALQPHEELQLQAYLQLLGAKRGVLVEAMPASAVQAHGALVEAMPAPAGAVQGHGVLQGESGRHDHSMDGDPSNANSTGSASWRSESGGGCGGDGDEDMNCSAPASASASATASASASAELVMKQYTVLRSDAVWRRSVNQVKRTLSVLVAIGRKQDVQDRLLAACDPEAELDLLLNDTSLGR